MNHKRTLISIAVAATVLISLFAVVSSAASVSGKTMAGTGPAVSSSDAPTAPAGYLGYGFFAVDTTGTLWHTNGGGAWDSLGGVCTASPAAVSWNDRNTYRLDVFVRGHDGALWHKYYQYQNGWSRWQSLSGQLAPGTGPAVSSWSRGRLDVFVQGTDGALWHKWYTGGAWSGWQNLGGKLTSSPAATCSFATSNIEVFVRGTDGAVWWKHWNGSAWFTWTSLGGQVAPHTGPAASLNLWLFVQGTDHQLWRKSGQGIGWTAWGLSGMPPDRLSAASPAAILPHQDTLVCVSGTSGKIWYSGDSLADWKTWQSVGSPP